MGDIGAIAGAIDLNGNNLPLSMVEEFKHPIEAKGFSKADVLIDGPVAMSKVCYHHQAGLNKKKNSFTTEDERLILTADCRIYNRKDLLRSLSITSPDSAGLSDEQIIKLCYIKWEKECLHRLRGDFAFVIWDKQKQILFCARDHLGSRPFYYHCVGSLFVFSSELTTIPKLFTHSTALDERFVVQHLIGVFSDAESTFLKNIRRLRPGHCLIIANGKLNIARYWRPNLDSTFRYKDDSLYVEAFRELFRQAVDRRLPRNGAAACLLSGGLDSSSIAVQANQLLGNRNLELECLSFVLPENDLWPGGDERPQIGTIAREAGLTVHYVTGKKYTFTQSIENSYQNIFPHPVRIHPRMLEAFDIISKKGIHVLFDGFGGDHVASYSGYLSEREMIFHGRFLTLYKNSLATADINGANLIKTLFGKLYRGLFPNRSAWRHLPYSTEEERIKCFTPTRFSLIKELGLKKNMLQTLQTNVKTLSRTRLRDRQWDLLSSGGILIPMEMFASFGARFGFECRFPMLDVDLIEFCLNVPCEQYQMGHNRWLIRRATEGMLPNEVRLRNNKNHSAVIAATREEYRDSESILARLKNWKANPTISYFIDVDKMINHYLEEIPKLAEKGEENLKSSFYRNAFWVGRWLEWYSQQKWSRGEKA